MNTQKETIIYVGGFELPDKNAAAHRVLSNAKIFRCLGKNVIFVGVDKELSPDNNVLDTLDDVQGFTSFSIPYPRENRQWIKYLTDVNSYIKVLDKYKDVQGIIFYNFPSIAMRKLMLYCKNKNIRCYADITEWYSTRGGGIKYKILKGGDTWYRMRILQKQLDGLIVISRYLKEYYNKCKNVIYLPPLVDLSEDKWKNQYKKNLNKLILVYAGTPGVKDRIDILIEALCSVRRAFHLDIIGITLDEYLIREPKHKSFLEDNKNIIFHGRLSHFETLDYIKKSNYSCFFRENDRTTKAGFPTKLAEAISCGTPVITNKSSNIDTYFHHGNGLCLDELNLFKIVECLENIDFQQEVRNEAFDYHNYIKDVIYLFEGERL